MAGQIQLPEARPLDPAFGLGIECINLNVTDSDGMPSNLIIPAGTDFSVSAKFQIGGVFAPHFRGSAEPYKVTYYYDRLGSADEGELGFDDKHDSGAGVLSDAISKIYDYSDSATRYDAVGGLPEPGTYKLSAVVTFDNPLVILTGFIEGPMIQIYSA